MKRILFYYTQLNIGGAEKSLIRLMNAFAQKGDDVAYLGRYSHGKGEYLLDTRVKKLALSLPLSNGNKTKRYSRLLRCFLQRELTKSKLKKLPKFDIAFVGLQGLSPSLLINKIKTDKLCVFIRSDISGATQKDRIINNLKNNLDKIDYFICVANTVKESLINLLPEAAHKSIVVYNILAPEEMRQKLENATNPFLKEKTRHFRIITVCRISNESKGIFRMVRICKRLVDQDYRFKWYVIGAGPDLESMKQMIQENGLEEVMITPGGIDNPFGYYRECDLVAMLSFREGLCGVVNEAKISGKAVFATQVSGINEQLAHGVNGWIVENDEDRIFEELKYLLDHRDVVKRIENSIYPDVLTNDESKLDKLYQLME